MNTRVEYYKDEEGLLKKVKEDKQSFEEIYKYFVNDVYRYSYSLVGNRHDAEDIVSQVFLEFYKKIDNFEWKGVSMKNWLFTTARFTSFKRYKRKISKEERFDEDVYDYEKDEISFVDEIMDKDLLKHVQKEIDKLPSNQKEVINLRIWEGMQFNQIADQLKDKEPAVKQRFYRGIKKIKKELEEQKVFVGMPMLFTAVKETGLDMTYKVSDQYVEKTYKSILDNTKNNMSKGIVLNTTAKTAIAVVLGVGVLTAGAVVAYNQINSNTDEEEVVKEEPKEETASQESDPYKDWLTYTNNMYGYALQYPADWKIKSEGETGVTIVGSDIEFRFYADVIFTGANSDLEEACRLAPGGGTFRYEDMGIDGECDFADIDNDINSILGYDVVMNAYKVIDSDKLFLVQFGSGVNTPVFGGDSMGAYKLTYAGENIEENLDTLQLITKSINKMEANAYKDWQIYKNKAYDYQLQYPSDWNLEEVADGAGVEIKKDNTVFYFQANAKYTGGSWQGDIECGILTGGSIGEECSKSKVNNSINEIMGDAVEKFVYTEGGDIFFVEFGNNGNPVFGVSPDNVDHSTVYKLYYSGEKIQANLNTLDFITQSIERMTYDQAVDAEETEALDLVRKSPEVSQWMENFPAPSYMSENGGKAGFTVEPEGENVYKVHVFEKFPDRDVTFGWYEVNIETKKVTKAL